MGAEDLVSTEDAEASAKQAADEVAGCVDLINRYDIGVLSGKLFAQFFNSSLKPLDT